jgi:uncharacterized protein (TIGR03435 family)
MRIRFLVALLAGWAASAQTDPAPAFEAASVKPNRTGSNSSSSQTRPANLTMTNVSLRSMITSAYRIRDYQLNGPDWLRTERFDVVAKALTGTTDKELMPMLRSLLVERFKLETHAETKEMPVYGLVVGKNGLRIQPVDPAGGSSTNSNSDEKGGELSAERTTMANVAAWIASRMDRPVLDMTGRTEAFTFKLQYSLESENNDPTAARYPILPLAIQEQLGLRLEKRTAPIEIVVVDRVEKVPIEN